MNITDMVENIKLNTFVDFTVNGDIGPMKPMKKIYNLWRYCKNHNKTSLQSEYITYYK